MTKLSSKLFVLLLALALIAVSPLTALAQSASPSAASSVPGQAAGAATAASPAAAASPGQAAAGSPAPAQAPGAPQPSAAGGSVPAAASAQPAAGSAQPAGAPASASAAPAPAGVATPVGSNPPQEKPEGLSIFAYLLIVLAGVWLLASIAGIIRLMMRPTKGPYAAPMPPSERDRHFLSFGMPFQALLTVAVIVVAWGVLFLYLASISPKVFDTDLYPFAVDLFVVCLVMLIATIAALRGGSQTGTEVH